MSSCLLSLAVTYVCNSLFESLVSFVVWVPPTRTWKRINWAVTSVVVLVSLLVATCWFLLSVFTVGQINCNNGDEHNDDDQQSKLYARGIMINCVSYRAKVAFQVALAENQSCLPCCRHALIVTHCKQIDNKQREQFISIHVAVLLSPLLLLLLSVLLFTWI